MTIPADIPAPAAVPAVAGDTALRNAARRAVWLKRLHQWHWISAALSLAGMLMFSITDITLNHAPAIESKARIIERKAVLPAVLAEQSRAQAQVNTGGQSLWNLVITGALISIVPLIVSFLTLQKYWQGGLSLGSVK